MEQFRIGFGEDAHRLAAGRPLLVGGILIPDSPVGADAHSDGDVLLHALSDALLTAFALGDIGHYFPPSNPNYKNLDSQVILQTILARVRDHAGQVVIHNVAGIVTLDHPKLGRQREAIERHLAELLGLDPSRAGVGFKTSEGLAPHHIQARVTVLLRSER